jgi:hypothetical protein
MRRDVGVAFHRPASITVTKSMLNANKACVVPTLESNRILGVSTAQWRPGRMTRL